MKAKPSTRPMVKTGFVSSRNVSKKVSKNIFAPTTRMNAEMIAETRIEVPVAARMSNLYAAGYGVGLPTIGTSRITWLSRPGICQEGEKADNGPFLAASNRSLKAGKVQIVTMTVRTMNGDHALMICPKLWLSRGPTLTAVWAPTLWKENALAGCQTLRNSERQTRLNSAELMSGSS